MGKDKKHELIVALCAVLLGVLLIAAISPVHGRAEVKVFSSETNDEGNSHPTCIPEDGINVDSVDLTDSGGQAEQHGTEPPKTAEEPKGTGGLENANNPGSALNGAGIAPLATGQITLDGVTYKYDTVSKEASITYGKFKSGHYTVPREVVIYGDTYSITEVAGYPDVPVGAFESSNITGVSFEEPSNVTRIGWGAFAYSPLGGAEISIPDSVTYVGNRAFYIGSSSEKLKRLYHKHYVHVDGSLPNLNGETPHTLPPEATQYESVVDSTQNTTTLHKSASWTNPELTEAEIRIDYGKSANYRANLDFIIVLDHSSSMLISTSVKGSDNVDYTMPRTFFTDDIVTSISQKILDSADLGYDNRVALTAFGGSLYGETPAPRWNLDFTNDWREVEEALYSNPVSNEQETNYNTGLQGAIDLINGRTDTSRAPIVLFLSDGVPKPAANNGQSQAQTLRDMGVKVYPISVYESAVAELKAISHDGKTAYMAADTDSFKQIIMETVEEMVSDALPLESVVEDTLSEHFELVGNAGDIFVSPGGGTVTLNAQKDKIIWDLNGCDSETTHYIIIKVKLADGTDLSASGLLPTNTAMGVSGGPQSSGQPGLVRYLAHYAFRNASDPGQPLPGEVQALLPPSEGGFRDGTQVTPAAVPGEVTLPTGVRWTFEGWDVPNSTINSADVTFTGAWRATAQEFTFIKTDGAGAGLTGAQFNLYHWAGSELPTAGDEYVSPGNILPGKWTKVNAAAIVSGTTGETKLLFEAPGRYQLVEATAPIGYYTPGAQWAFTIGADYTLTQIQTVPAGAATITVPDFIKTTDPTGDVWSLPNYFETEFAFRKITTEQPGGGTMSAQALDGAEFALYLWKGAAAPQPDQLVTPEGLQQGTWQLAGTASSAGGGRFRFLIPAKDGWIYQLVETQAPPNFQLPSGQWRLSIAADGTADVQNAQAIPEPDGKVPPALGEMQGGPFAGEVALTNHPVYELPATGGVGRLPALLSGGALLAMGFAIYCILRLKRKRR